MNAIRRENRGEKNDRSKTVESNDYSLKWGVYSDKKNGKKEGEKKNGRGFDEVCIYLDPPLFRKKNTKNTSFLTFCFIQLCVYV